jgi:hypothetical protein
MSKAVFKVAAALELIALLVEMAVLEPLELFGREPHVRSQVHAQEMYNGTCQGDL